MLPAAAHGQAHGRSFDAGIGVGTVHRGTYKQQTGPAVTLQWAAARESGFVAALSGTWQAGVPTGDDCRLDGNGGCLQTLPHVGSIAALAGYAHRFGGAARRWSLRTAAGPGVTRAGTDGYGDSRTVGGVHGRIDLASPRRRIALVASLHGAYIPALPRGGRGTRAVTIGVMLP